MHRDNWKPSVGFHLLHVIKIWLQNISFLDSGSHKPAMCNALSKWLKMAENRKLIDAKQPFSFVFKPSNNQRTAQLVKNLSVKIMNFCKLIPHCENVTFWFCYFKTMVMTRYHKWSLQWNPSACPGANSFQGKEGPLDWGYQGSNEEWV